MVHWVTERCLFKVLSKAHSECGWKYLLAAEIAGRKPHTFSELIDKYSTAWSSALKGS